MVRSRLFETGVNGNMTFAYIIFVHCDVSLYQRIDKLTYITRRNKTDRNP